MALNAENVLFSENIEGSVFKKKLDIVHMRTHPAILCAKFQLNRTVNFGATVSDTIPDRQR